MTKMTRADLRIWLDKRFCGCGEPDAAAAALLKLLRLHPLFEHRPEFERWIPDEGVQNLLLYQLDEAGVTEHGGTVGGGWLTEFGITIREALAVEESDDFDTLFVMHCVHGIDVDDTSHHCT